MGNRDGSIPCPPLLGSLVGGCSQMTRVEVEER